MSGPLTIARINGLDETGFVEALGFVFEHSPWVVRRSWRARPFASRAALHAAMMDAVAAAGETERLALIRAHPELAGKAAIAGALTAESRHEQGSAGLDQLTAEEFARFHELNAAYAARFGFPFVICVRLGDKRSILEAMRTRLARAPDAELAEAVAQIGLISRLRLFDAVAE
jgi:2-oxo-4-hydroxy-4-carboxy-5-ureidoimidazoline decarboxylase